MANNMILERLEGVKSRFIEVGDLLTQPEIHSDMKRYVKLNKEYKDLQPLVESYERYKLVLSNIASSRELLSTEKDDEKIQIFRKIFCIKICFFYRSHFILLCIIKCTMQLFNRLFCHLYRYQRTSSESDHR